MKGLRRISLGCALVAVACSRPNPPAPPKEEKEEQLAAAISKLDADAVDRLLAEGVDPLSETASGARIVKLGLEAVTGTVEDRSFPSKEYPPGDTSLRIMRAVMAAVRARTHEPFESTGRLENALEMGAVDPNRGRQMRSHFYVTNESGERAEIAFSIWETDYVGIRRGRDGVGNPLMPVGGVVKVTGARRDGLVEATRIEFVDAAESGDGYESTTPNYLPSTWAAMLRETWLH